MRSKLNNEGYFLIDHRNSPGITPEFLAKNGIKDQPAVGAGKTLEMGMTTCHGCQSDVYRHPGRTRPRAWCRKHDGYLCDNCDARRAASGGECKPLTQMMEELWNRLTKRRVF